jgi:phosphoribosyl 1,2-cyclic phosphate phosphodiesterase
MSNRLDVTILGCGSSGGVPRLGGADCAGEWGRCDRDNPRNRRSRCSLLVQRHGQNGVTRILVDTSPDMREQLLRARVTDLDGVLLTHDHADQLHGFDDLRQVVHIRRRRVDVYTDARTAEGVLSRFSYCFVQPQGSEYPTIANMHAIPEPFAPFVLEGAGGAIPVFAFAQRHGSIRSLGFRFGPIAYSPDVNALDEAAFAALAGVECWIVDALRTTPHPSHAHVALALEWIARVKPRHAVLTNLHHDLDYEKLKSELPENVEPAYDGLTITAGL